jgi:DNA repair exonuclease SbcCD ATPase subunit
MKNKIVVWGTNAAEEKVLIALELKAEDNKVLLYTFPEAAVTDAFYNQMMNDWKNDRPVEFPEHTVIERPLAITDSLLPDDLKSDDRSGVLQRAQTEWHFVVLSTKLHQAYQQELAEFKEKIAALQNFDEGIWEDLRAFWDKVQEQTRERNLFRSHADSLRDNINELFEKLRSLRNQMQQEAKSASQMVYDAFIARLEEIEQRIAAGSAKISAVFEDLKIIQRDYRDAKMTNEHRNRLWDRIDKAFKAAKERRFGPSVNEGSIADRFERRIAGLREAAQRIQDSIRRDEEDLEFQNRKIATTEGQLEAQIRVAKIKMIEERLNVKREKLKEVLGTLSGLERQLAKTKEKEAARAAKEAERKRFEAAKAAAQAEIAQQVAAAKEAGQAHTEPTPADAPTTPAEAPGDDALTVAARIAGESLQDAVDTARAIGQVLGEKTEEAADKAEDWVEETLDKAKDIVEKIADKAEDLAEEIAEKAQDFLENILDKAKEMAEEVADDLGREKEEAADATEETPASIAGEETVEVFVESVEETPEASAPKKRTSKKNAPADDTSDTPPTDAP